jgi:hypothetical protein
LRILFSVVGETSLMVLVYVSPAHGQGFLLAGRVPQRAGFLFSFYYRRFEDNVFCLVLVASRAVDLVLEPPIPMLEFF